MKVSIIVPIYNVEKYIKRCIDSIFLQTYQNIEYIFVDDCTPDLSVVILKSEIENFQRKTNRILDFKIISHKQNKGLAAARNTGLDNSTGDYIIHIDSDDYIDHLMIEEMCRYACCYDYDIIVCDYYIQYSHKRIYSRQCIQYENPYLWLKGILNGDIHASNSNKLVKRNLYISNNISFYEGLNMMEDLSVMFRLFYYSSKIGCITKPYLHYTQLNEKSYTYKLSNRSKLNMISLVDIIDNFFMNSDNYSLFSKNIDNLKMRIKIDLLLSSISINELREYGCMYKNVSLDGKSMPLYHKVLLKLLDNNMAIISFYYVNMIQLIKNFLNEFKK